MLKEYRRSSISECCRAVRTMQIISCGRVKLHSQYTRKDRIECIMFYPSLSTHFLEFLCILSRRLTANIVVCRKFSRQEGAVCNIGSYRVVRVSFSSFIDLEVFTSRNLWAFFKDVYSLILCL